MDGRSQPKENLVAGIAKNIPFPPKISSKTLKTLTSEKEDNIEPKIFVYFQAWQRYYLGHQ